MMETLESLRDALTAIPGVQSCKIGLEENLTPDDYPMIRIVPGRIAVADTDMDNIVSNRRAETLIYFGMPIQPFDDVPDSEGRVRLEKLYAALFDMESSIISALSALPCAYLETITDEDRLDTYKLMAVRCEIQD